MKKIILFTIIVFSLLTVTVNASGEFEGIDGNTNTDFLGSPQEIVDSILSGTLELDGSSIADNFVKILFSTLKEDIPLIISLISCSFILALVESSGFMGNTGEIASIGGKAIMATLILSPSIALIHKTGNTLDSVTKFTSMLMPPITTLLASSGAQTTVAVLTPSSTLISTVLINIISKVVFPLIVSGLAISLCSGCIKQLSGITNLIKSVATWIVGIVFTLFSGVIAIQGAVSSVSDGLSIKSLKYAISSSVPIIGSNVGESTSMIITSAFYLKSAGGIMGMIVLFGICFAPLLEILCFYFSLKAVAEIMNIYSNGNAGGIIKSAAEYIKLAGIALLGVVVIWIVFLGLIIKSGGTA